jgi:hypothetical protein
VPTIIFEQHQLATRTFFRVVLLCHAACAVWGDGRRCASAREKKFARYIQFKDDDTYFKTTAQTTARAYKELVSENCTTCRP